MVIAKYEQAKIEVVTELSETDRGEGGFGSTGKQNIYIVLHVYSMFWELYTIIVKSAKTVTLNVFQGLIVGQIPKQVRNDCTTDFGHCLL